MNSRFLPPLEGKNYEVGAKGAFFDGRLNTSAALFQLQQGNLAEPDPGNIWIIGTGGGSYAYHTVQGATTRGFEAEVSGQLRPDWQLTASYAYSRIRNAEGQRIQTSRPQDMAKLWTTWRLPHSVPGLTTGGYPERQQRVRQALLFDGDGRLLWRPAQRHADTALQVLSAVMGRCS